MSDELLKCKIIRSQGVSPADIGEKLGTILLAPMRQFGGRTVTVYKDLTCRTSEEYMASKIKRLAVFIFGVLFLPVTLPTALLGAALLETSKSFKKICDCYGLQHMGAGMPCYLYNDSDISYSSSDDDSDISYSSSDDDSDVEDDFVCDSVASDDDSVISSSSSSSSSSDDSDIEDDFVCDSVADISGPFGGDSSAVVLGSLDGNDDEPVAAIAAPPIEISSFGVVVSGDDGEVIAKELEGPEVFSTKMEVRKSGTLLQITCDRQELSKDCVGVISMFADKMYNNIWINDFRVTFIGEKGIDGGALRREFITDLFKHVSLKLNLSKGIPNKPNKQLTDIGTVMSWLIDYEYQIGECINPAIYEGICSFSLKELEDDFEKISSGRVIELYMNYNSEAAYLQDFRSFLDWSSCVEDAPEQLKYIKEFIETMGVSARKLHWFEGDTFDDLNVGLLINQRDEWENLLLEEYDYKLCIAKVENLYYIAKELVCGVVCKSSWEDQIRGNGAVLRTTIEGYFDKDLLLEKFRILGKEYSSALKEDLKVWVDSHSEQELRLFLKCVTGAYHIPFAAEGDYEDEDVKDYLDNITLEFLSQEDLESQEGDQSQKEVQVTACFNTISILNTDSRETLHLCLDSCIDGKSRFGVE
jgi:hypothetical protein